MEYTLSFLPEIVDTPTRDLVAALIIRNKKLLMVYNIKDGLRIEPPGGKAQQDEQGVEGLRRAVKREPLEELRMNVEPISLLGVYETKTPEGPFDVWMYVCESTDEPKPDCEPDKIGHFEWMGADDLKKIAAYEDATGSHLLVPNMRQALGDILAIIDLL
jgi:8-oxo-dGTP pyrophosphatase MutT (NUDIX family)